MKIIFEQFLIAKLRIKEIFGQLSPQDQEDGDFWKEKNPKTDSSLYDLEEYEERKAKLASVDISKEWRSFQKRNTKKHKTLHLVLKYAASIIILLSLTTLTYWRLTLNNDHNAKEIALLDIPHGEKIAELTLSNGQSITLAPGLIKAYRESDGTLISNDSLMLSYRELAEGKKQKSTTNLYNELHVIHGGEYFIILSDGTKVWLNSLSTLKYPVKFSGKERIVELSGEAYFEVAHDPDHCFVVKNRDYDIRVLGTSFNISCYDDDDDLVTTLAEGNVEITNIKGAPDKEFNLIVNDQMTFNRVDRSIILQKVDAKAYSSWTEGVFCFENEPLEKLFHKLERWYNINVFFLEDDARNVEFTGILPRHENFKVILEMLETIGEVEFTVKEQTIMISVK
jgi:transmembrane sensor